MVLISLFLFLFSIEKFEEEFSKSLDFVLELSKHYKILEDHPEIEKLNEIGYSISANLEDNVLYSFQIIDIKEPNAFAIPGGFIFVTKGMLDLKLSDNAIASLLAHEIIHIKNKHIYKMEKRQALLSALSTALLMGVLFGVKDEAPKQNLPPWWSVPDSEWGKYGQYETKKDNLIEGTYAFSIVFQELLMQGYSRELEMESDREGTYLLAQAGFSPDGSIELLEKLKNHYYEAPDLGYWRSHPYLEDRLELAKVRVSQLKEAKQKIDPVNYRKKIQEKFYLLYLKEKNEEKKKIIFNIALNSCRKGILSFDLNLKRIFEIEKKNLPKNIYERKYENLLKEYKKVIEKFKEDPEVHFNLKKLEKNYQEILKEKSDCYIFFKNHFYEGSPSTNYLSAYFENYKDLEEDLYPFLYYASSLLKLNEEEGAVEVLKEIYNKGNREIREKILEEISINEKNFKNLCAIYSIFNYFEEKFIKENFKSIFLEKLKEAESMEELRKFLDKFPESEFYLIAFKKLEEVAEKNYIKGRAYKSVGAYQAALEIYNKILENAYDTKVASKIRNELKEGGKL